MFIGTFYNGLDNSLSVILETNKSGSWAPYGSLSTITRMIVADEDGGWTIDSNSAATAFDWATEAKPGEVIFDFAGQSVSAGTYTCYVKIYDAARTNGFIWDYVDIEFVTI